jgi:ParB family transcriptional regulator, chromosome partitioning protein
MKGDKGVDLSGLGAFSLTDLGQVEQSSAAGVALQLHIALIDEDGENARTEYDEASLAELADSIKVYGVKEPISVRRNGDRFKLNSGSRRLRASKLAGKTLIPGFVDEDADEFTNFIVNEQRDNLSPMDIANFLAKPRPGFNDAAMAKKLGKSKAYVSQHRALINLPDTLRALYDADICRSPTVLVALARMHSKNATIVDKAIEGQSEITKAFIVELEALIAGVDELGDDGEGGKREADGDGSVNPDDKEPKPKPIKLSILLKHEGKTYRLHGKFTTDSKPKKAGKIFVSTTENELVELPLDRLELDGITFTES